MNGNPSATSSWEPRWKVDVGSGCEVGVTIDDHCFVVLVPDYETRGGKIEFTGGWKPTSHIPRAVARFIGEKANEEEQPIT